MTDTLPQRNEYPDEISLVDIAITFIRRRYVFYVVFVVVTLLGLAYALLASEQYQYVSLIQVAQKENDKSIEAAETTIAALDNRWLPEAETAYRAEHEKKLPFQVAFSNPENTGLIRFSSEANPVNAETVTATHQALIDRIKSHQDSLIKREKNSLARQMASLNKALGSLEGQQNAGEAIASAIEKHSRLEGASESLKSVEVLVTSRQSAVRIAPRRSLIVVLSVLLGGTLGIFAAFMSEFFVSVRKQLAATTPK